MAESRYDRALTVFSPDGHLFQVEYAMEAVHKGTTAVAVRGTKGVVIAVERKMIGKLQDPRTVRKIVPLDENVMVAFAGLQADARSLIDEARIEAQSYRLYYSDSPKVEFLARYVAEVQQQFTQSHGVRPYGVAMLFAGHDPTGEPKIFESDPSGTFYEWKANAVGRSGKTVLEYLEKHYDNFFPKDKDTAEPMDTDKDEKEEDKIRPITEEDPMIELVIRALLEVVERGKSIEVAIIPHKGAGITRLDEDRIEAVAQKIQSEKEERKKKKGGVK